MYTERKYYTVVPYFPHGATETTDPSCMSGKQTNNLERVAVYISTLLIQGSTLFIVYLLPTTNITEQGVIDKLPLVSLVVV